MILAQASGEADTECAYAEISPAKYLVDFSLKLSGVESDPEPCTKSALGSECLPQVQAAQDSIIINWTVDPSYTVNTTSSIKIRACYSNESSASRPWRAAKPIINKDNQCKTVIAEGQSAEGSYIYSPGPNTAPASYQIQVLEICEDGQYCSFGESVGFYQINKIDDRPAWYVDYNGFNLRISWPPFPRHFHGVRKEVEEEAVILVSREASKILFPSKL
ncbi:hypothetical protein NADE_007891 [Nannochloris sp. 'desiccata']|nr:hypothetical protein NADE_007891 [Chlorella desiccata (nom. nud.)]